MPVPVPHIHDEQMLFVLKGKQRSFGQNEEVAWVIAIVIISQPVKLFIL